MALPAWLLVAGFMTFMVGAAGWRIEYEQPLERSLPVMHEDRRRLRWIHTWMVPGVVLTTAGLGGLAVVVVHPGTAVAATGYALGAVVWVIALLFRLTVGEWAAERAVATGTVPEPYPVLARWSGHGHALHMLLGYLTAIPLAWSLADANLIPAWLAFGGSGWGLGLALAFVNPATRVIASPPFWAHAFTFAVGVTLLL